MKSLERDIKIERITMSAEKQKFQNENVPLYGLYDDEGLEGFIPIGDIFEIKTLDHLMSRLAALDLRARFNTHRNIVTYVCWASNEVKEEIDLLLSNGKYLQAKSVLIEKVIFV
ncbi:MAG: hypothetical protein H0X63_00095 [Flavobacteriales bacterium]|nr:hypothetical protein [Flavobacteriales bacterium]